MIKVLEYLKLKCNPNGYVDGTEQMASAWVEEIVIFLYAQDN